MFCLCVCIHLMRAWCLWKPEKGIWVPWNRIYG